MSSLPLRMAGAGLVSCACGRAFSLQVLWLAVGQGPGELPTHRTRALRRALKISCTTAACAAWASVSVRMAGCSCSPSASARIWCIAKTGAQVGRSEGLCCLFRDAHHLLPAVEVEPPRR